MKEYNNYKELPDIILNIPLEEVMNKQGYKNAILEEGVYHATIEDAKIVTAKNGRPYISVMFIIKQKSSNIAVWKNFFPFEINGTTNEQGKNMFIYFLRMLGFSNSLITSIKLNKHLPVIYKLECILNVGKEVYKEITRNCINSIKPNKEKIIEVSELKERMRNLEKLSKENQDQEEANKIFG